MIRVASITAAALSVLFTAIGMIRQADLNYLRDRDATIMLRVERLEKDVEEIRARQIHNEDRLTVLEKGKIRP